MADKIHFPLDSEAYLRKGKNFLIEGKKEEGIEAIEKAYELNDDLQINLFYARVLITFEKFEDAFEIMSKEKTFYVNNEKYALLYTKVLIKTQRFIEAEYILQKYDADPSVMQELAWDYLEQDLIEEREIANVELSVRRENIKRSLRELEQYSYMVQVRKIKEAEILDLHELQKVAPAILISGDINAIVQRSLLELLIQKGDQNVYSFQWLNQIKKVCPADLPKIAQIKLIDEINEKIEEKLFKYPELKIIVNLEITNDLLLLYPFIEENITDVDFWVDNYIHMLDFLNYVKIKPLALTEEQQEMMKWIDYLNIIAQRN